MRRQRNQLSPADYLTFESAAAGKHEYVDGEMYALAGASRRHNVLVSNLIRHAGNAAARARNDCQVFGSDMKVHVPARNCFYYPDVTICCSRGEDEDVVLVHPCCIIEVTSPATAGIDRREKRIAYASLKSLHEYIIVDQERRRVDVYPRAGGPWLVHVLTEPEHEIEISCLGLRLALRDIYAGVDLSPRVGEAEPLPEYAPVDW